MPERRELVAKVLAERPRCEFPARMEEAVCVWPAVDVHEPLTRARGGSILDERNALPLCRRHHDWVHDHPAEAAELLLLRHSWDR